jgi:hypothetical protein
MFPFNGGKSLNGHFHCKKLLLLATAGNGETQKRLSWMCCDNKMVTAGKHPLSFIFIVMSLVLSSQMLPSATPSNGETEKTLVQDVQ